MELTGAKPARIMSIDALRGFDMLMIIFADRFFYHLGQAATNPVTATLATHFNHPEWYGFHFYDIIMPLFLFMVGAVIPYSLHRRVDQGGTRTFYLHLLRRFAILFFLGWIVQGNLLAID
ncbi:MAG: DUF5009 domain-containing protein, partial [Cyclobacteriaceae bacterium]|nr:DUF5009 domain-containing protein [Cyclobacteriaceae bacterium]